jgi:hypothetical protein
MNGKGFGRKGVVGQTRHCPGICLEGLKKTMRTSIKLADVPIGVQTQTLPNTYLELTVKTTYLSI